MEKLLLIAILLFIVPCARGQLLVNSCTGSANSGGTGNANCNITLGANHVVFVAGIAFTGGLNFSDTLSLCCFGVASVSNFFGGSANDILTVNCFLSGAGGADNVQISSSGFNGGFAVMVFGYSCLPLSCTNYGPNAAAGTA